MPDEAVARSDAGSPVRPSRWPFPGGSSCFFRCPDCLEHRAAFAPVARGRAFDRHPAPALPAVDADRAGARQHLDCIQRDDGLGLSNARHSLLDTSAYRFDGDWRQPLYLREGLLLLRFVAVAATSGIEPIGGDIRRSRSGHRRESCARLPVPDRTYLFDQHGWRCCLVRRCGECGVRGAGRSWRVCRSCPSSEVWEVGHAG